MQAEIYIPFVSNEFRCGIFLGHRFSHVKFEQDELPLITLISSQLAQRLIMTFIIKELLTEIKDLAQRSLDLQRRSQGLQGITNSLFRNIEQERKSIAREIQGFDPDKLGDWLLTGAHYGIAGMKERIENLGGNLQVNSAIHRGTTLKAIIPVK